jgi:hypothetical protein
VQRLLLPKGFRFPGVARLDRNPAYAVICGVPPKGIGVMAG